MNNKVGDKVREIEEYLSELGTIIPSDLKEYKQNFEKKAACERYFEKIIEAVIDLSFLLIKDMNLKIPEEDKEAFDILSREGVIPNILAERLKDAKGMRNILAHEYGVVDDGIVFQSITEELMMDVGAFIKAVGK